MGEEQRIEAYLMGLGVDAEQVKELLPMFRIVHYEAGQIILRMGERTEYMCLILKGMVRGYYLDGEGNDITKCFTLENDWCCFYNYVREESSSFYIEAIEDLVVGQVSIADMERCLERQPFLGEKMNEKINKAFIQAEERNFALASQDAKQRYKNFIETSPEICKRVKQEQIATYLGITPSSLCRIKREL